MVASRTDLFIQVRLCLPWTLFNFVRKEIQQLEVVLLSSYYERCLPVVVLQQTVPSILEKICTQLGVIVLARKVKQSLIQEVLDVVHLDKVGFQELDYKYVVALEAKVDCFFKDYFAELLMVVGRVLDRRLAEFLEDCVEFIAPVFCLIS